MGCGENCCPASLDCLQDEDKVKVSCLAFPMKEDAFLRYAFGYKLCKVPSSCAFTTSQKESKGSLSTFIVGPAP